MPLDAILSALDRACDYWGVEGNLGTALTTILTNEDDQDVEFLGDTEQ